jgi:lysophospholipase L1-like esterase
MSTGNALPLKTALTLSLTVALLWLLPHVPGLGHLGGFEPQTELKALFRLPAPAIPWRNTAPAVAAKRNKPAPPSVPESPDMTVFDAAMRHFDEALARTDSKTPGAVTRVLHFGDSPVTADSITADLRARLQARFGDAGHGFLLIAKPWAWYGHRGIDLRAKGWSMDIATQDRASDGFHGLGGVSFRGGAGATSIVRLPDSKHTGIEVQYLEQPGGGSFRVSAGGQVLGEVHTAGPEKKPAYADFAFPPDTNEVELEVTSGPVRAFGYDFSKPGPGVVYSSLGLNGGQVQAVLRYFEPGQWTAELRHENPDLVVVNYGTNESVFPQYIVKDYAGELRKVIARIHAAVPEASILIMSPMDRGERDEAGEIVTAPVLPRIVEIQKETAAEMGCAFFNTYEAMGGAGTMGRWYVQQPRLVSADFTHPFPAGAAKVGALVDDSLLASYTRYRRPGLLTTAQKADKKIQP